MTRNCYMHKSSCMNVMPCRGKLPSHQKMNASHITVDNYATNIVHFRNKAIYLAESELFLIFVN